jgi:predicted RNA binding protein YcfA (HicA-like mRNA interferase family)
LGLIRRIEAAGAIFVREGGSHTVYQNPRTGLLLSVPRHREISEKLARTIIREAKK